MRERNICTLRAKPPRCEHAAVDVARHTHIAGTIAGENTVLLVSREPLTGVELADEIRAQRLQGAA